MGTVRESGKRTAKKQNYLANRELSWLKFNERVLEEAADKSVPLCERLSFLSIFQSNLDEFFMVRVGSLYDQMLVNKTAKDNKTGMTSREQLMAIFDAVRILSQRKDLIYKECIGELMAQTGVESVSFASILPEDKEYLKNYFTESILPLLSPQVIGKKQPFPFLKNKEVYAVVVLGTKNSDKLGIIPCSNNVFERLVKVPSGKGRYILVEELILHFLPLVFERYTIKSKSLIRIIRNADIDVDEAFYDEDLDYRDSMEKLIRVRKRLCPVKLEHSRVLDDTVIEKLRRELGLFPEQVFFSETPLETSFLSKIQDSLRENRNFFYDRRVPQQPADIAEDRSMIAQIEEKDRFLSFPFESMKPFLRLIKEAGKDENVVSIRMTLYRVAKNSQIVESLIEAAENGKEVVVLVELRARFDEENNIEWSRRLEEAGCRIIYGIDHIKVHSKLCLITYKKDEKIHYITQVGTGNYNEKTAKLYTDLSLMTANEHIGEEAAEVFHALCLAQLVEHSEYLLVAPNCLQNKVLLMIEEEIGKAKSGKEAYIGLKMNALTDKVIIDKLVEASQAGVKIDLIVRGICCLIPGVSGYTDNVRVISIVGRYLEHSRIYIFGKPEEEDSKVYIASADFMTRNTTKRVEVAAPILDADIKERIVGMFHLILRDNVKARELGADGNYFRRQNMEVKLNSQEYFYALAYQE
ncbi:MAG: polyphosphate kinase 1 [Roseburia sp.]|nr:polyphosphate kinase 1 [Roseburia sp.]